MLNCLLSRSRQNPWYNRGVKKRNVFIYNVHKHFGRLAAKVDKTGHFWTKTGEGVSTSACPFNSKLTKTDQN